MAKNFYNRTNIIAKHYTIFLQEEILEFFMGPMVKTHLTVLAQVTPHCEVLASLLIVKLGIEQCVWTLLLHQ